MLHVTCDQCGKELRPGNDDRYVVKIEVYAAQGHVGITEEDLEQDHMEEISQLLQDIEDNLVDPQDLEQRHHFRFDLCPECRRKFLRDPLAKEAAQKFDFSEN